MMAYKSVLGRVPRLEGPYIGENFERDHSSMASNTDDDFESGETIFHKRDSCVCDAVMAGDHGTMYGSVRGRPWGASRGAPHNKIPGGIQLIGRYAANYRIPNAMFSPWQFSGSKQLMPSPHARPRTRVSLCPLVEGL